MEGLKLISTDISVSFLRPFKSIKRVYVSFTMLVKKTVSMVNIKTLKRNKINKN